MTVGSPNRCIPNYMGKAMTQHNDVRCELMRKSCTFSRCTYAVELKVEAVLLVAVLPCVQLVSHELYSLPVTYIL